MATFNVDSLDFVDDEEARFGADSDFATRFDSGNSRLELEDLTNATVGYVPQNVGTDLVGGKFAETVSEGKALADDGNVYDSIQDAENAANSWVKVGPGDFRESVAIDTDNLTLVGSGDGTSIIVRDEPAIRVYAPDVSISRLSAGNVAGNPRATIQTYSGATSGTITNITISQSTDEGVRIDHGDGWIINDIRGDKGCSSQVVQISGSNDGDGDSVISNIKVDGSNRGIFTNVDNVIISHCTIENTVGEGIDNAGGGDVIIIGNVVRNCGSTGIDVGNNAPDTIVANNRIHNCSPNLIQQGSGTVYDANLET